MTAGGTAGEGVRERARAKDTPLSLGYVPCTTLAIAGLGPKIPMGVGDSWRPVVAGLLGVAPLAVAAAITGASLMGGATAASKHAGALAAQVCVAAVTPGSPGQLKLPECYGD